MASHGDVSSRHDVVVIGAGPAAEAAGELGGNQDVVRMANTPTYTYACKLPASGALARLHPDVLRAMPLPSRAHRI